METIPTYPIVKKEELRDLMFAPELVIRKVLQGIEEHSQNGLTISDPTSPFITLLETTVQLAHEAILHNETNMKHMYPSLAATPEHLAHHMSDEEIDMMFAIPSKAIFNFMINVADLKDKGEDKEMYREVIIPFGTSVTVSEDLVFTLLNDISVKLYTTAAKGEVEIIHNPNPLSSYQTGIIDSCIVSDNSRVSFISFDLMLYQVRIETKSAVINKSIETKVHIPHPDDQYCYSESRFSNKSVREMLLKKALNESYVDPYSPTITIKPMHQATEYRLPSFYKFSTGVSGTLRVDTYLTRGEIYVPISNYPYDRFKWKLGNDENSLAKQAMKRMAMIIYARTDVHGGRNIPSLNDLRKNIIFNSTGTNDLPITDSQLKELGSKYGYEIVKDIDVLTERNYIAFKPLLLVDKEKGSNMISATAEFFFNKVKLVVDDYKYDPQVSILDQTFIIKSGTVFKENNGVVSILPSENVNIIRNFNKEAKMDYLRANNLFITPFYYVVDIEDGYTFARVYDLDYPRFYDKKTHAVNQNSAIKVNASGALIEKVETGYRMYITLTKNEIANNKLADEDIEIQIAIPLKSDDGSNTEYLYFISEYVRSEPVPTYRVDFNTSLSVDTHDQIEFINARSRVKSRRVALESEVYIYILTQRTSATDLSKFLHDRVYTEEGYNTIVFTAEVGKLKFGDKLSGIYSNLYNAFNQNKYKRYPVDVPKVYTENVYAIDSETGTIVDREGNMILEHKKGDPILVDNQPQLLHRAGDYVYEDGLRVVDTLRGITRYITIAMVEYEFYVATSTAYIGYRDLMVENLKRYVLDDIPEISARMLENTQIHYKSHKQSVPIKVRVGNKYDYIPFNVSPYVKLYVRKGQPYSTEMIYAFHNRIGQTFDRCLNQAEINTEEIGKAIIEALNHDDRVVSVKITGLYEGDPTVIQIEDPFNRPILKKLLRKNQANDLIVRYDITLDIEYI